IRVKAPSQSIRTFNRVSWKNQNNNMLPEKSQGKVLQATVMAVGPGARNKNGELQPVNVKVGEKVLLPEYGGTKVDLDDKEYYLFREWDILGKYVD
uniref:10 kDa heat shock protein, mitochondrial n=1 Tax=Scleropages formosus TaxID=113540 RepID=A0A8C9WH28_SCLFO